MDEADLKKWALELTAGEITGDQFLHQVHRSTTAALTEASVDLDRERRCGYPEVVYGEGKSLSALREISARIVANDQPLLITRLAAEEAAALAADYPAATYNETARTFRVGAVASQPSAGKVAVVSAGTTDAPVAEEAIETLCWMGIETLVIKDVGVAGPHRLQAHVPTLRKAAAIVVAAGLEGALPSVVGGYVSCPVVAVPTSVGYGTTFGGITALLGMLNSCASNIAVVNIDAGFKAGYYAGVIAGRAAP